MAFGKQGRENGKVSNPMGFAAIFSPVAAGVPAFLRRGDDLVQGSNSTVAPRHTFVKAQVSGMAAWGNREAARGTTTPSADLGGAAAWNQDDTRVATRAYELSALRGEGHGQRVQIPPMLTNLRQDPYGSEPRRNPNTPKASATHGLGTAAHTPTAPALADFREDAMTIEYRCPLCNYQAAGPGLFVAKSATAHMENHDQREGA